MRHNQKLSSLLRDLARLLDEEASINPGFAAQLDSLFIPSLHIANAPKHNKRNNLSRADIPDVLSVFQEKGEEEFRFWLRTHDIKTFKAILKVNGFDVARASQKWTDPDKFVQLITEQTVARLRRGASFLQQKTNSDDPALK